VNSHSSNVSQAAAYYYHGLVLDKGTAPTDHVGAVYCLFASEELLRDSKRACLSFCLASPVTRCLLPSIKLFIV